MSYPCKEAGCKEAGKYQIVGGGHLCQYHFDVRRYGEKEAERLRARRILQGHRVVVERVKEQGVVGFELKLPPGISMSLDDFLRG